MTGKSHIKVKQAYFDGSCSAIQDVFRDGEDHRPIRSSMKTDESKL